jgi:hypothetical protein
MTRLRLWALHYTLCLTDAPLLGVLPLIVDEVLVDVLQLLQAQRFEPALQIHDLLCPVLELKPVFGCPPELRLALDLLKAGY